MRLSLNLPIEALLDEGGLAWDVSGKGHWGNGLAEDDDFAPVMGLVRQAFEYQMGGD
jgi:predicted transport protein